MVWHFLRGTKWSLISQLLTHYSKILIWNMLSFSLKMKQITDREFCQLTSSEKLFITETSLTFSGRWGNTPNSGLFFCTPILPLSFLFSHWVNSWKVGRTLASRSFWLESKNRNPIQQCDTIPIQRSMRGSPDPQEMSWPQLGRGHWHSVGMQSWCHPDDSSHRPPLSNSSNETCHLTG